MFRGNPYRFAGKNMRQSVTIRARIQQEKPPGGKGNRLNMPTQTQAWPTEIRLHKDRRTLTVAFDSGESFAFPAEYLRVKSPSAEVQGHAPEERKTVPGKRYVAILEVQPIGN